MHSLFFLLWQRCQQTATCLHIQQKQSNIGVCLKLCIWTPDECKSNIYPSFSYGSFSTMEKLKLLNASLCSLAGCLLSLSAIWCLQKTAACCGWKNMLCVNQNKWIVTKAMHSRRLNRAERNCRARWSDQLSEFHLSYYTFSSVVKLHIFLGYCCCS